MNAMFGLLVPALLGVDFGWERKPDGTIEYIVQVDPQSPAEMQRGSEFGSAVPAALRSRISDVTFRVGNDPLPNQNTFPAEENLAAAPNRVTANYPPNEVSTSTGGQTWPNPGNSRWPAAPTNPAVTSAPASTSAWPNNGAAPVSASVPAATNLPPPPSSGFPMNPTAPIPTNNPTTAAWPSSTSPPSLSGGPHLTAPQTWATPPREVTISAKPPLDPGPPTNAAPSNAPSFNNNGFGNSNYTTGNYPPANQAMQPTQPYTGGYPPNTQPQPNYAPQPNMAPPGVSMQPNPNDAYYRRPNEPQSPSDKPSANAVTSTAAEPQWGSFVFVFFLLLVSVPCNLYFGWRAYQMNERVRMLIVDRGTV